MQQEGRQQCCGVLSRAKGLTCRMLWVVQAGEGARLGLGGPQTAGTLAGRPSTPRPTLRGEGRDPAHDLLP